MRTRIISRTEPPAPVLVQNKYFGKNDLLDPITTDDYRFCRTEEESLQSFEQIKERRWKEYGWFGLTKL